MFLRHFIPKQQLLSSLAEQGIATFNSGHWPDTIILHKHETVRS